MDRVLLDELDGLRALARSLVRGDVDDLVQDTAVAALAHPPALDRPVRPWLAAVLRNRWRMDRRGAGRRAAREAVSEVPEAAATPAAMLDRARLLERLAAALVALDEPFREAVILRYLDGRSAADIARASSVPEGTVRWRVKTGLERLRAALDADTPRSVWQRALAAPLIGAGVTMKKTIAIGALLALLLLAAGVWIVGARSDGDGARAKAAAVPPAAKPGATRPVPVVHGGAGGDPVVPGDPDPLPGQGRAVVEPMAGVATGELRGRVINWSTGDGVEGADLTFAAADGHVLGVRSGADGSFAATELAPGGYALAAVEASGFLPYAPEWHYSAVRLEARPGLRVRGLTVFLFPAVDYHGVVVDGAGQPVAGAQVALLGSPGGEQALVGPPTTWTSDRDGHFVFHAPDDAVLEAVAGKQRGRARLDTATQLTHQLTIAIGDRAAAEATIAGRVVDAQGAPMVDVLVRAQPVADPGGGGAAIAAEAPLARAVAFVSTDADGGFVLRNLDAGRYDLATSADRYAPVVARAVPSGTTGVQLVLTEGSVLAGTVTGGGDPIPAFTLLVFASHGASRELVTARSVIEPGGHWRVQVPDGDYVVLATASGWAPSAPTAATPGEPVTLTMTRGSVVRGRVISRATKAPLAYARVMREAMGGGASAAPANAGTVTRDDGSFELTGVPPGRVSLTIAAGGHHPRIEAGLVAVEGADLGPLTIDLKPLADGEEPKLELVGIGVQLATDGDALRVTGVIPGGGAEAAGVAVGDRVLAVEGAPVTTIGLDGAIERIRGTAGTSVRVVIDRAGASRELAIERKPLP